MVVAAASVIIVAISRAGRDSFRDRLCWGLVCRRWARQAAIIAKKQALMPGWKIAKSMLLWIRKAIRAVARMMVGVLVVFSGAVVWVVFCVVVVLGFGRAVSHVIAKVAR